MGLLRHRFGHVFAIQGLKQARDAQRPEIRALRIANRSEFKQQAGRHENRPAFWSELDVVAELFRFSAPAILLYRREAGFGSIKQIS